MNRLPHVLRLLDESLRDWNPLIRVIEHFRDEEGQVEYPNVRVAIEHRSAMVVIREYWRGRMLVAYGYYVRVGGYEEWWDNRPHHPELPTHPHHRHVGGRVEPLPNPSLECFIARVRSLLLADHQQR